MLCTYPLPCNRDNFFLVPFDCYAHSRNLYHGNVRATNKPTLLAHIHTGAHQQPPHSQIAFVNVVFSCVGWYVIPVPLCSFMFAHFFFPSSVVSFASRIMCLRHYVSPTHYDVQCAAHQLNARICF